MNIFQVVFLGFLFVTFYAMWASVFFFAQRRVTRAVKAVLAVCSCIVLGLGLSQFVHPKKQGQLTACKSNLKDMATTCEMYATDNHGIYPANLALLTPSYLRVIPQCPGGSESYGYERSVYAPDRHPSAEAYTIVCRGLHHYDARVREANYPQYSSHCGLVLP